MARVSVIIPYFKGTAYLEDCVASIEAQKLEDYEIIIVHDKDGTEVPESVLAKKTVVVYEALDELPEEIHRANKEAAESWREQKIREHVDKRLENAKRRREELEELEKKGENTQSIYTEDQLEPQEDELIDEYDEKIADVYPFGVSYCRNIGLEKATGDYVYFIDCDDYLLDDALVRLVRQAEEKQAVLVTGNKVSTWFKPANYDPEKAKPDSCIEGVQRLSGKVMEERFYERYSVQHLLIRRDFLKKQGIVCDTDTRFYSDIRFCVEVLQQAKGNMWIDGDSVYAWRHRNDQVHLPALCQKKRGPRGPELLDTYNKVLALLKDDDKELRYIMDRFVVDYFYKRYPDRVRRDLAPAFSRIMQDMPEWKRIMKDYRRSERLALRIARRGKFRMSLPFFKLFRMIKKKKGLLGSRIQWYRQLEKHIFKKMPLRRDWVFIESFFGKSYSIFRYILFP